MAEGPDRRLSSVSNLFRPPVLIVSTHVGRGMHFLGEAFAEQLHEKDLVGHFPIEELLPPRAVNEDLKRYRFISSKLPFLLNLVYRIPLFYYRKFLREKLLRGVDLGLLRAKLTELKPNTVLCISHRAAFWISCAKQYSDLHFEIWDVLGEYGDNLGYRYLFWDQISGFLSPVPRESLTVKFPAHVRFVDIELPARKEFSELAKHPGDFNKLLLVCGYWGQGPIVKTIRMLRSAFPDLELHVVCGDNDNLLRQVAENFSGCSKIRSYGTVDDFASLLMECAAIITKPGISTIVEAHAAKRKIFLLRGMPVAEDNNARYAIANFGADWFSFDSFSAWYMREQG